ncbi:MAG: SMP-30/gluconolactonase/LRE family protein [Anaerolineae bacterium]|nr:MAG: SMP-30/gluconolactonase/LRE family protein [Anaerolineae bacterium]
MPRRFLRCCTLLLMIAILMVGNFPVAAQSDGLPDEIVYRFPNHFPEGIAWDSAHERFLLGSLTVGTIVAVTDDGTVTPFVEFDTPVSTVGLEIAEERGRLLVAISDASVFSDMTAAGVAMLGAYDLETGEELWVADLTSYFPDSRHFANDVAVDPDTGIAYLTDSLAGAIYYVNPDGSTGVWFYDTVLQGVPGVNGIAVVPGSEELIVANTTTQMFYLISLSVPAEGEELVARPLTIDGGETKVVGDGLVFDDNGVLTIVGGGLTTSGRVWFVTQLSSDDNWQTASSVGRFDLDKQASTGTIRDGQVFIIYPEFEALNAGQNAEQFTIQRIDFSAGESNPDSVPTSTPASTATPAPAGTEEAG